MVACGFAMLILFAVAFYYTAKKSIPTPRWVYKAAFYSLPLPWIASEAGWFVAEYGRQPWTIAEVLPVHVAASNLSVGDVVFTLIAFTLFYTAFFFLGFYLMKKYIVKGPTQYFAEADALQSQDADLTLPKGAQA